MDTIDNTQVEAVRGMTNKEVVLAIRELQAQVASLTAAKASKSGDREMTDEDAFNVAYGDCSAMKHKDAAAKLGLSYGQVYSCRGEFTFKAVHKAAKEAGKKNAWTK